MVGESLVDVVTTADGSTSEHPGGSPMNVAVGLGRLGHQVQLLTALGADDRGNRVADHVRASHVEVLAAPLRQTSVARAQLDAEGVATYAFELVWDLRGAPEPTSPTWLHVGSLGVTQEPGAAAVADLVTRTDAVVSYDPNCRPLLMGSPAEARQRIEEQVSRSDVVKLSDEDAAWLFPEQPHDELARRWLALGPAVVVMTLGPHGSQAWTARHTTRAAAAPGGPVVDTVGAGDAFMAGLLSGLHDQDLRALDAVQLDAALDLAGRVARRTCERAGADPPWARGL